MKEQIEHLIQIYEKRYLKCLEILQQLELEKTSDTIKFERRYYQALSLLWKTVIKDLKEIGR